MNPWSAFQASNCLPDNCGCEFIHDSFFRQPINTASSLIYIFLAWWLYREARHRTFEFKLWTASSMLLGIGSFLGHMTFTQAMMSMDFASIILLICFFSLNNLLGLLKVSHQKRVIIFLLFYVALVLCMYVMEKWVKVGLCFFIFALALGDLWRDLGLSFLKERVLHYFIIIMLFSFALFLLDEFKVICEPTGHRQLHSLWHIGTAVGIYIYGKWRFKSLFETHPARIRS